MENKITGIIQEVNFSMFCDAFWDTYKDNFTYKGKQALFDHLQSYSEDIGEPIRLDTVALCCEYAEYLSAWDAMKEYQPEDMPIEGEEGDDLVEIQEKNEAAALEWLENRTTVIPVEDGGIIIEKF